MLERDIEQYLVRQVRKLGGIAYKFTSPGRRSVPDRLCLFPEGVTVFCELKAPGKKPTKQQWHEIDKLRNLGFQAVVIDSKGGVDTLIKLVKLVVETKS